MQKAVRWRYLTAFLLSTFQISVEKTLTPKPDNGQNYLKINTFKILVVV